MAYSAEEVAHRAGVASEFVAQLAELGLIGGVGGFDVLDARKAACASALHRAGIPLEVLARAVAAGAASLEFVRDDVYERFAATSNETFAAVAGRTGVSIALLSTIREALGSPPPDPDDYMRDEELAVVPYVATATMAGLSTANVERMLRVQGEALRRVAETEGDSWFKDILGPAIASGKGGPERLPDGAMEMALRLDEAIVAILHAQQGNRWLQNVVRGIGSQLAAAGLHEETHTPPAIVFLDITGYTRLTQERGDEAAAEIAGSLGRIVQRTSAGHGGKPVKWLGDGVMFHFDQPSRAVESALEMVSGLAEAGLPPAHVGVHCGDVLFQQGDYFGQTVNVAARIADFARPGEVLVSHDVVRAGKPGTVDFVDIGDVELKGLGGPVHLFAARAAVEAVSS